jgi:hypothetical protein
VTRHDLDERRVMVSEVDLNKRSVKPFHWYMPRTLISNILPEDDWE